MRPDVVASALYHIAVILNAASGPLCMGACTRLSLVWFAEDERTIATAIAQTSNGLGTSIGFLNSLWVTKPSQIPFLFYLSLGLSFLPFLCARVYFPAQPPAFPSAAAEASSEMSKVDGDVRFKISAWKQSLVASFKHRSFLLLMLAVSVLSGVASGWQGVLQSILNPAGINAKWPGFGNGIAGNLAAVVSGVIVDKFFRRRLKTGIVLGLIACFAATLWFTLSLPSVFSSRSLLRVGSFAHHISHSRWICARYLHASVLRARCGNRVSPERGYVCRNYSMRPQSKLPSCDTAQQLL